MFVYYYKATRWQWARVPWSFQLCFNCCRFPSSCPGDGWIAVLGYLLLRSLLPHAVPPPQCGSRSGWKSLGANRDSGNVEQHRRVMNLRANHRAVINRESHQQKPVIRPSEHTHTHTHTNVYLNSAVLDYFKTWGFFHWRLLLLFNTMHIFYLFVTDFLILDI